MKLTIGERNRDKKKEGGEREIKKRRREYRK